MRRAVSTLYRVRSLALQPLSAGNSAEFSQADNSKSVQLTAMNLISLEITQVPVNQFMYTSNLTIR